MAQWGRRVAVVGDGGGRRGGGKSKQHFDATKSKPFSLVFLVRIEIVKCCYCYY